MIRAIPEPNFDDDQPGFELDVVVYRYDDVDAEALETLLARGPLADNEPLREMLAEMGVEIDRPTSFDFSRLTGDAAEALEQNRHRHYDPTGGRWTSDEPVGFAPDMNVCRYVANAIERSQDAT